MRGFCQECSWNADRKSPGSSPVILCVTPGHSDAQVQHFKLTLWCVCSSTSESVYQSPQSSLRPDPLVSNSTYLSLIPRWKWQNNLQVCLYLYFSDLAESYFQKLDPFTVCWFWTGAKLVPFDSDDTDDEDSPSPSSTLQSQASHSTISSSYGSELKIQSPHLLLHPDTP